MGDTDESALLQYHRGKTGKRCSLLAVAAFAFSMLALVYAYIPRRLWQLDMRWRFLYTEPRDYLNARLPACAVSILLTIVAAVWLRTHARSRWGKGFIWGAVLVAVMLLVWALHAWLSILYVEAWRNRD